MKTKLRIHEDAERDVDRELLGEENTVSGVEHMVR